MNGKRTKSTSTLMLQNGEGLKKNWVTATEFWPSKIYEKL